MKTYYDRPVLKEPVWHWYIPAYFFTGGVAAGTSLLAFAAGDKDKAVSRRCQVVSLGAVGVSTALLVADLGRPKRFLNMLRVAKVTSPMSVGTWLLSAFGASTTAAVLFRSRVGRAIAAALAPAIATYTAVLIADTAVPAWHEARADLPYVFAGGALASSGSIALLVAPHDTARRVAVAGAVLEVVAARRLESRGRLSEVAQAATVAGAGLVAASARTRRLGALLVIAGAATERFAIFETGKASARDAFRSTTSAPGSLPA